MRSALARLARIAATAAIVAGLGLGMAGTASAHDVLVSSNPVDGSTVAVAPSVITFTFDQPVQNFDPVVSLIGPDGRQYATGSPTISGNVVTGTVSAGPAGAYDAAYRIVSADGHPVTGQVKFTLAGDDGVPSGAAASSAGAAARSAGSAPSSAGSAPSSAGTLPSAVDSAVGPAAGPSAAASAASTNSGGLSTGLWIALVVAALVIVAAAVVLLRRPGSRAGGGKDY